MSPDNGAIHHPVFHIRLIREMLKHPLPHTVIAPAPKPLVDTIPLPILLWQQPPLCAAAVYPKDCFQKLAALALIPNIRVWVAFQKFQHFGPLFVA